MSCATSLAASEDAPFMLRSERMCRGADAVLLIEALSTPGTALVLDVMKDVNPASVHVGATMRFKEQGRTASDTPIQERKRYLVFAHVDDERRVIVTPASTFEMTGWGIVQALNGKAEDPVDDDDLHGAPEGDVLVRVRRVAKSDQCAASIPH
jgi:hypothetical protein